MSKTVSMMFLKVSIVYFLIVAIWGAVLHIPDVGSFVREAGPAGMISSAHSHLGCAWLTMVAIGAIYYLAPVISAKSLYSERLGKIHFWTLNISVVLWITLMTVAGWLGGSLFMAEELRAIGPTLAPYSMSILIIGWIAAGVNFLLAYNIYRTLR